MGMEEEMSQQKGYAWSQGSGSVGPELRRMSLMSRAGHCTGVRSPAGVSPGGNVKAGDADPVTVVQPGTAQLLCSKVLRRFHLYKSGVLTG